MRRGSGFSLAAVLAIAIAALAGSAVGAQVTLAPPKVVACGDIAAGTWTVRDKLSGKGLTGSHYTVGAIHFPCSTARTLAAKLTRRRSLGPGPTSLLPGYTCLTGIPKGFQLEHGGCAVGTSPILMPTANIKSFKWQACRAIPTRHQHVTCTTRSLP
jgi:hypothetical protein